MHSFHIHIKKACSGVYTLNFLNLKLTLRITPLLFQQVLFALQFLLQELTADDRIFHIATDVMVKILSLGKVSRDSECIFVVVVIVIFVVLFLPWIYSGAPWVTKSTHPKKFVTVICHSMFHFDSSFITVPALLFHHHCSTITAPPHCSAITVSLHCSTLTVLPLPFHHYRSITTVPL